MGTVSAATKSALSFLLLVQTGRAYTLIGNGNVYTVDDSNSWAEALAIDDEGSIVAVGTENNIRLVLGKDETDYWDLDGRMVLPGFQDVHLHAVEAGINAQMCYVEEDMDLYRIAKTLRRCPDGGEFGDQGWIIGVGIDIAYLVEIVWDYEYEYPIQVLDQEFPDTPVLILDNLGHAAVVNSAAMALVGYDDLTGNPPGGKIDRDPETGKPTGVVRENAQQKFRDAAFPPTAANQAVAYDSLLDALGLLAAYGITSVSDAGGFWKQAQTEAWFRAETEGTLTVRASNAFYIYPDIPISEQALLLQSKYRNDLRKLLRWNQAKIYVDGILSLTTAALYEPYDSSLELEEGEELGFEYFGDADTLQGVASILSNIGYQLHFHVTGDRAATLALDAIEFASTVASGPHRLTHCYLVAEEDRARFEELNVIADFQLAPSSVSSDYEQFIADLIGKDRASELLPAKEIFEAGGTVTLSSDWDADDLSPLSKLKTVLTRPDGKAIPDLETAIRMMTMNPATLLKQRSITGSIEVGKEADLVILNENIFEVETSKIDKAFVVATLLRGERIYDPDGVYGDPVGKKPSAAASRKLLFALGVGLGTIVLVTVEILF